MSILVAHRGFSEVYPENTLLSLRKALEAGVLAVEFDVQLTADKVPVLFHDFCLKRMIGESSEIKDVSFADFAHMHVRSEQQPEKDDLATPTTSLKDACSFLKQYPHIISFIEVKPESVDVWGCDLVMSRILETLGDYSAQTHFLSSSVPVIEWLHKKGCLRTGWVVESYDESSYEMACSFKPRVIACSFEQVESAKHAYWPGDWQWMLYHTENPKKMEPYIKAGIHYLETNNPKKILAGLPGLKAQI